MHLGWIRIDRIRLINNLDSNLSEHFNLLTSVIVSSDQDDAVLQRQRDQGAQIVKDLEEQKKQVDNRVKDILDQIQKAAASAGVVSHAKHFHQEAERCRKSSRIWLIATSVSAGVAAYISVCAINQTVSDVSGWVALVQMIVGRFSLMALAYFVTIWLSRMYRAARHNEVVNRHRVNALKTFETFASAARDDAAKDAVLMRATECIFHHQASGFADSKSEPGSTRLVGSLPQTPPVSSSAASPSSQGDAGP